MAANTSAPSQGGPSSAPEKKKSKRKRIGRIFSRMTTALRRTDRNKYQTPASVPLRVALPDPRATSATIAPLAPTAPKSPKAPKAKPEATANAVEVPRSKLFAERARRLGAEHGLQIRSSEFHNMEGTVLRVEKPIMMRVHRHCHVCRAGNVTHSFGAGVVCSMCGHRRCKNCPRVPPKRTEDEREASHARKAAILKERAETAPIMPDFDLQTTNFVLRRPAKIGGQDLIYRKPRQRVRRHCCKEGCQKLFANRSDECECGHKRCTDCTRHPGKKDKYPYGYPGDEFGVKIGHFECHECKKVYRAEPPMTAECPTCQHKVCESCERMKPRRVEPEWDPEVWRQLQEKLQKLKTEKD